MTRSLKLLTLATLLVAPSLAMADSRGSDDRDHRGDRSWDGRPGDRDGRDTARDHRDDRGSDGRYDDRDGRYDDRDRGYRDHDRWDRGARRGGPRGWVRDRRRHDRGPSYPPPPPGYPGGHYEDLSRITMLTQACDHAFVGSQAVRACVDLARTSRVDLSYAIPACSQAVVGNESGLQCVQLMAAGGIQPTAIGACQQGFVGNQATLQCMATLAGSRYDANQLVTYCRQSTYGNADGLSCLASFRGR